MTDYQPGVCNIGDEERRKRRLTGVAGFAGAIAYAGVFLWFDLPDPSPLGLFAPVFGGFLGIFRTTSAFASASPRSRPVSSQPSCTDSGPRSDRDRAPVGVLPH